MSRHAALMDADGFWRQFVVAFYFDAPGDELAGGVLKYWADGPLDDLVPHLRVQQRDGRTYDLTVSQERLKALLVKEAPAVGDRLRIVYTGDAPKAPPGMTPAKLFTVEVVRKGPQGQMRTDGTSGETTSENAAGPGELAK